MASYSAADTQEVNTVSTSTSLSVTATEAVEPNTTSTATGQSLSGAVAVESVETVSDVTLSTRTGANPDEDEQYAAGSVEFDIVVYGAADTREPDSAGVRTGLTVPTADTSELDSAGTRTGLTVQAADTSEGETTATRAGLTVTAIQPAEQGIADFTTSSTAGVFTRLEYLERNVATKTGLSVNAPNIENFNDEQFIANLTVVVEAPNAAVFSFDGTPPTITAVSANVVSPATTTFTFNALPTNVRVNETVPVPETSFSFTAQTPQVAAQRQVNIQVSQPSFTFEVPQPTQRSFTAVSPGESTVEFLTPIENVESTRNVQTGIPTASFNTTSFNPANIDVGKTVGVGTASTRVNTPTPEVRVARIGAVENVETLREEKRIEYTESPNAGTHRAGTTDDITPDIQAVEEYPGPVAGRSTTQRASEPSDPVAGQVKAGSATKPQVEVGQAGVSLAGQSRVGRTKAVLQTELKVDTTSFIRPTQAIGKVKSQRPQVIAAVPKQVVAPTTTFEFDATTPTVDNITKVSVAPSTVQVNTVNPEVRVDDRITAPQTTFDLDAVQPTVKSINTVTVGSADILFNGIQPTISTSTTAFSPTTTFQFDAQPTTVSTATVATVDTPLSTVDYQGLNPAIRINQSVSAPQTTFSFEATAPGIVINAGVTPGISTVTFSSPQPGIISQQEGFAEIKPGASTFDVEGFGPTIATSSSVTVQNAQFTLNAVKPAAAGGVINTAVPTGQATFEVNALGGITIRTGVGVTPGDATVNYDGVDPLISTSSTLTVGTAAVFDVASQPVSVTTIQTALPDVGTATFETPASIPTVRTSTRTTTNVAKIRMKEFKPTTRTGTTVTTANASMDMEAFAPVLGIPVVVTAPQTTFNVEAIVPSVTARITADIAVGITDFSVDALGATVDTAQQTTLQPGFADVLFEGQTPTIIVGADTSVLPGTTSFSVDTDPVTVTAVRNTATTVNSAQFTFNEPSPVVTTATGVDITPNVTSFSVDAINPSVLVVASVSPASAAVGFNGVNPQALTQRQTAVTADEATFTMEGRTPTLKPVRVATVGPTPGTMTVETFGVIVRSGSTVDSPEATMDFVEFDPVVATVRSSTVSTGTAQATFEAQVVSLFDVDRNTRTAITFEGDEERGANFDSDKEACVNFEGEEDETFAFDAETDDTCVNFETEKDTEDE